MEGMTGHEWRLATLTGAARAGLLSALVDLEVFYETHPAAPVPYRPVLSIRVPDGTDEERRAAVDAIAEAIGAQTQFRNGVYMAAREFGPLMLEAHFTTTAAKTENARRVLHGEVASAA